MSDDVVIFLSYAHDDDLILSPDPDELGFVSFLDQQLRLKLRDLGARQANVWRDRRRISQGDQFADIIDDGLNQAELFVVVMSPNWMQRPYCRKEFETFFSLRKAAGVANPATRMLVVGKGYVDRSARPPELQGQEGFLFYSRDDENDVSAVTPFFNRGKCNDRFYAELDDLAGGLQKRVTQILSGAPAPETTQTSAPIVDAERPHRLSREARKRHEGGLCSPRHRASGQGLHRRARSFGGHPERQERRSLRNRRAIEGGGLRSSRRRQRRICARGSRQHREAATGPCPRQGRADGRSVGRKSSTAALSGRQKFSTAAARLLRVRRSSAIRLKALERFDQQIATDKIDGDILSKFIEYPVPVPLRRRRRSRS